MSSATHAAPHHAKSSHAPARPQTAPASAASFGGQALDRHTQSRMSARFGHDFSQVRVHTDAHAGDTAHALGANAFTLGQDIVFGAGRYAPGSAEGDRLLAHELTHVVQQDRWGGPGDTGPISRRGDASEQEAESLDHRVAAGEAVDVKSAPGARIACDMFGSIGDAASDAASSVGSSLGSGIGGIMGSVGNILGPMSSSLLGDSSADQTQAQAGMGQSAQQMEMISKMLQSQNDMSKSVINNMK